MIAEARAASVGAMKGIRPEFRVTWAVAKRDFRRYFSNPAGYVFITLFIFLGGGAAIWRPQFFLNNLANLDQLNEVFPLILLFFVPALTMGIWTEERKHGTEELLLTLPGSYFEVIAGKTLAALGVYTVAIVTSFSHVLLLTWLGHPDAGLLAANYFAYWAAGAALIPVGMLASILTANQTIAFILAVVFSAAVVLVDRAAATFSESLGAVLQPVALPTHFAELASGLVSLSAVVYFGSVAALFTYANVTAVGRKHWPRSGSATVHRVFRAAALGVIVLSTNVILARPDIRLDVTAERVHSIADETRRLLSGIATDRPVTIQAFVSPAVPAQYVQPRETLVSALRDIERIARGRVRVRIEETDAYSAGSRAARERFGIVPRIVSDPESTRPDPQEILLAVAFTSGGNEQVLPFFDRGMSAEYEIARGIRGVSGNQRRRIGIVDSDAKLLGGMDFETGRPRTPWTIVAELQKEYEIVRLAAWEPIEPRVDALLVALPSSLLQREMDHVIEAIKGGVPALVLLDPLPAVDIRLAPAATMAARVNPYRSDAIALPEKNVGNVAGFVATLGIAWPPARIVWDGYRPHPDLAQLPREIVFVGPGNGNATALNPRHATTGALQEVVLMYPGYLEPAESSGGAFEPLLTTGRIAGSESYFQLVRPGPEGFAMNANLTHEPGNKELVLAAHVRASTGNGRATDVIVAADVDFIADGMFELRASRPANAGFDNVTFLLNCLDVLAGDQTLLPLRSRRVRHRTLERVEQQTRTFLERRMREEQEASAAAENALESARNAVKRRVEEIQNRADLDSAAKLMMARNLEETENRRLSVLATNIEVEKNAKIRASREQMETEVRRIEGAIRIAAVALPPIPIVCLGLIIFMRRRIAERRPAVSTAQPAQPA